jgi:ABC-type enterochelin transport system permease subunit
MTPAAEGGLRRPPFLMVAMVDLISLLCRAGFRLCTSFMEPLKNPIEFTQISA